MQGGEFFEYLSAFVTVVLALALSDMIQSTHRIIRARGIIRWDVRPLILAAFVYLTVLAEFFSLWDGLRFKEFSFLDLLGEMVVPTVISLAAFAVLPDEVGEGFNFEQFFLEQRHYIIGLLAGIYITDTLRSLLWLERNGHFERWAWEISTWYSALTVGHALVLSMLWFASTRKWQLIALAGLLLIAAVGYYGWEIDVG